MRVSNDGTCNERFEGTSSEAAKRRGVKYTAADESSAVATLPGNFIQWLGRPQPAVDVFAGAQQVSSLDGAARPDWRAS